MIQIYTGDGHGKSLAALGKAVQAASEGKDVVIIQFLKGNTFENKSYFARLEPEVKIFSFEKSDCNFCELTEEEKEEAVVGIRNGLNYAKKVLSTGECDLLILDEALGLLDHQIISMEEFCSLLESAPDHVDVVITGIHLPDAVCKLADEVSKLETIPCK